MGKTTIIKILNSKVVVVVVVVVISGNVYLIYTKLSTSSVEEILSQRNKSYMIPQ